MIDGSNLLLTCESCRSKNIFDGLEIRATTQIFYILVDLDLSLKEDLCVL